MYVHGRQPHGMWRSRERLPLRLWKPISRVIGAIRQRGIAWMRLFFSVRDGDPAPSSYFFACFWKSGRYFPYPSAARRETGMNRSAAEFMQ